MILSIRGRRGLASLALALFWLASAAPVSARINLWDDSLIAARGELVLLAAALLEANGREIAQVNLYLALHPGPTCEGGAVSLLDQRQK
jgi:hypothetical protein